MPYGVYSEGPEGFRGRVRTRALWTLRAPSAMSAMWVLDTHRLEETLLTSSSGCNSCPTQIISLVLIVLPRTSQMLKNLPSATLTQLLGAVGQGGSSAPGGNMPGGQQVWQAGIRL